MTVDPCPSPELLRRSLDLSDTMTDDERLRIETHVEACERGCKAAIEGLLRGQPQPEPGPTQASSPPVEADAEEPLPASIGRYQVTARLGAGGMGVVYRAHDPQLGRDVAIKVPTFRGADDARAEARQRFLREARAAAAVRHPNICPIYDVGEDSGRPYVVMAFVAGESLAERLRREGRFENVEEAVALMLQVADALAAVHAATIIHRDLKPGNILLDHTGLPLLTDFGLARSEDHEKITLSGTLLGTPGYLSPEQANTDLGEVGPWSDQYSLGVVLYQLLTGRRPFEGPSLGSLIFQLSTKSAPSPSEHRPGLDPALEKLVMKTLSRQPQDRYGSVAEFAQALRTCLQLIPGSPGSGSPRGFSTPRTPAVADLSGPSSSSSPLPGGHTRWLVLVVVLLVLLTGAGVAAWLGYSPPAAASDFEGTWTGTYFSNGGPVPGSKLSLHMKGDSLAGDWDGYRVIESSQEGNVVTLQVNSYSHKYGAAAGVHHYVVECTYNRDRTLSILYDGIDASGNRLPNVHGFTEDGKGFVKQ